MSFLSNILDLLAWRKLAESARPAAPAIPDDSQLHDAPDPRRVLNRIRGLREDLASDYQAGASDMEVVSQTEERLKAGRFQIPMLPEGNMAILDALANPRQDIGKITEMIRRDAVLTASVLKTANSAFYNRGVEVADVREAVARIGFRELRLLMLTISTRALILHGREILPLARRLWDHSIGCAVLCQRLAKIGGEDAETLFTGGLLHDVGKIVVLNTIREVHKNMREYVPPTCVLGLLFDLHHQPVGARLAESWALPAKIANIIACHHAPLDAACPRVVALAALANGICHLGENAADFVAQADPRVIEAAALSPIGLRGLYDALPEIAQEIVERISH